MKSSTDLDFYTADGPRCPYCGYKIEFDGTEEFMFDDDNEEECPECEGVFTWIASTPTVYFETNFPNDVEDLIDD